MARQNLEAKFQTVFKHYLQNHWNNGDAAFELKRVTGNRVSVHDFRPQQIPALTQVYESSLYFKIPDEGFTQKPFDCFVFQQSLAYVVIAFGERLRNFHLIPIWSWNKHMEGKISATKGEIEKWDDVEVIEIPKKIEIQKKG